MKNITAILFSLAMFCLPLVSCMKSLETEMQGEVRGDTVFLGSDTIPPGMRALYIANEGNFMAGNASLSYYIPGLKRVVNEVFVRANGFNLGDVAQSMVVRDGLGYVVVNNSGVIYVIDANTFALKGMIKGFTSPRYIHFLSDTKAYVTQIWDSRIAIVDPVAMKITGYIPTDLEKGRESTEQMVQYGKYVFTNCWSHNNRILVIDTETDSVVDEIETGMQPASMVMDRYDKIWTVTDGGYQGSPFGQEAPTLYCIDAQTRRVEREFRFSFGDRPSELKLNGTRDTLYLINKSVWRLPVTAEYFPLRPFLQHDGTLYYGLAVDPATSEVYVADAVDHVQRGVIYRYTAEGVLVDKFRVGVTPGAFCFKD